MDDIASLGFSIDSSQALQAQLALDRMAKSAMDAQRQQQLMIQLAQEQNAKLGDLNRTLGDHQRAFDTATLSVGQHNAALANMSKAISDVNSNLETLHVRMQNINIKEKIDDAVAAWSRLREMSQAIGSQRLGYTNFANATGDINGTGIPAEAQVQIMSRLTQALSDQTDIGSGIRGSISGVGVNTANYGASQQAELFHDISAAINDMSDSYSRATTVQKIFGTQSTDVINAVLVNSRNLSQAERDAIAIEDELARRRAAKTMEDFQNSRDDMDAANKRLSTARSSLASSNLGRDASAFGSSFDTLFGSLTSGDTDKISSNFSDFSDSVKPFLKSLSGYLTQASLSVLPYSAQANMDPEMLKSMGLSTTPFTSVGGPENYTVKTFQDSINQRKNMQENWFTWSAQKEQEYWEYAYQAAVDGGQKDTIEMQKIQDAKTQAVKAGMLERRQISDIEFNERLSAMNPYDALSAQRSRLTDFRNTRNPIEIANQLASLNRSQRSAADYTNSAAHQITLGNIAGEAGVQGTLDQSEVQLASLQEKAGIISTVSRQFIELKAAQDAYNATLMKTNEIERDANDPNSPTGRDPKTSALAIQSAKNEAAAAAATLKAKQDAVAAELPMADQQKQMDNERANSIEKVAQKYAGASQEIRNYFAALAGTEFDINKQTPGDTSRINAASNLANQALARQFTGSQRDQNTSLREGNAGIGFQIQAANQGYVAQEAVQIQYENDLLRKKAEYITDPKQKQAYLDEITAHQQLQIEQNKLNASLRAENEIRQNKQDIELLQYEASLTGVSADERQRLVDLKRQEMVIDQQNISPDEKSTLYNQANQKSRLNQINNDMTKEAQLQQQIMGNALQNIQGNFATFFTGINTGASGNWKSMTSNLANSFNNALGQMESALITRPLIGAFLRALGGEDFARSMGFGGTGAGGMALPNGGALGSLFGGGTNMLSVSDISYGSTSFADAFAGGFSAMAKGGAFSGGVRFLSSGGLLDGPTAFTDMGGSRMNVGGEAGTEAVMPLTRGPDGNLGVRSHGGGQSIYIDARGSQAGVEQRIRAVLAQERPGIVQQSTSASIAAVRYHADSGGPFSLTVGRRRR